jgi:chromosome partitioning protein
MATKISIINFKGGVGKTTLAFHLATYLARSAKVLVVDIDHQSSMSIALLGGSLWEECKNSGKTCNRIFESFCNRKISMPGQEIIVSNVLHKRQPNYNLYPNLDLLPAQFELDDTEIEMASTTMGGPTVSEWTKRTLLAEWLDAVNADMNYDYIVFDCPPATKLVSQNALAASDYFVIPVIPDELSSRGVTHFKNLVTEKIDKKLAFLKDAAGINEKEVPKAFVPTTRLAGIVPFMAKTAGNAASGLTNIHTEQIAALRKQWQGYVLKSVVKHLTGVPESMSAGWPVWDQLGVQANVSQQVVDMMENVCSDIKDRINS